MKFLKNFLNVLFELKKFEIFANAIFEIFLFEKKI